MNLHDYTISYNIALLQGRDSRHLSSLVRCRFRRLRKIIGSSKGGPNCLGMPQQWWIFPPVLMGKWWCSRAFHGKMHQNSATLIDFNRQRMIQPMDFGGPPFSKKTNFSTGQLVDKAKLPWLIGGLQPRCCRTLDTVVTISVTIWLDFEKFTAKLQSLFIQRVGASWHRGIMDNYVRSCCDNFQLGPAVSTAGGGGPGFLLSIRFNSLIQNLWVEICDDSQWPTMISLVV